jgi:hypothetical protein
MRWEARSDWGRFSPRTDRPCGRDEAFAPDPDRDLSLMDVTESVVTNAGREQEYIQHGVDVEP